MPRSYEPCCITRKLLLYPGVTDRSDLHKPLAQHKQLLDHLPRQLRSTLTQLSHPTLWTNDMVLTLESFAAAVLAALLAAMCPELQAVGSWLAQPHTVQYRKAVGRLAPCDRARIIRSHWDSLSAEARREGRQQAALALSCNPPAAGRRAVGACMCIDPREQRVAHISWTQRKNPSKAYPVLVLQQGVPKRQGQPAVQRCVVPAHVLVAWLFHGAPGKVLVKGKQVKAECVCHHDMAPARLPITLKWEVDESQHLPAGHVLVPGPSRCLSKCCVNPLCLHWSTQSLNAASGSTAWQKASRKAKVKQPVV
jgi:hypothetical protein